MPPHPLLLLPRQSRHQTQLLRLGIAGILTQDRSCWIQPVKKKKSVKLIIFIKRNVFFEAILL